MPRRFFPEQEDKKTDCNYPEWDTDPTPIAVGRLVECSWGWVGTGASGMDVEDAGGIVTFEVSVAEKVVVTTSLEIIVAPDGVGVTGGIPR